MGDMVGEAFWAELRRVHRLEDVPSLTGSATFAQLRTDLLEAFAAESPPTQEEEKEEVSRLEAVWECLVASAFREANEYEGLVSTMAGAFFVDPAAVNVDLLGVLNRGRHEPYHTLVLGALIAPSADPLGAQLFRALLTAVGVTDEIDAATLAARRVAVEREARLSSAHSRGIRPDIVVDFGSGSARTLVVIENKIGIVDREGQLGAYREWAEGEVVRPCLVYLTPRGSAPAAFEETRTNPWRSLSYAELAIAFRAELRAATPGPWRDLLGLYLGTIMQHVVGHRLPASSRTERALLVPYLRAAIGWSPSERLSP